MPALSFDAATLTEYNAVTTAADRAQAVINALSGTVSVKVYNGSNAVMGSGVMQSPWATRVNGVITVGEFATLLTVTTGGTPDANWYLQFENGSGRYVRGTFGLAGSGKDFVWSLPSWNLGDTGSLGTVTLLTGDKAASGGTGGGPIDSTGIPTDKYRFQQPLLFQRAHVKKETFSYTSPVTGLPVTDPNFDYYFTYVNSGLSYGATYCGTDRYRLCKNSQWGWDNEYGDYLDNSSPTRIQQGTTPWASAAVTPFPNTPAGQLTFDVTQLVQYCNANKKWYAFLLKTTGSGIIKITGPLDTNGFVKSTLEVVRNGATEVYDLWYASSMISSNGCDVHDDFITVSSSQPGVIEFFRPTDQSGVVTSATLKLQHRGTQYGSSMNVQVFLVNPLLPSLTTPVAGIAAAYPLDAGLYSHSSVVAALRITDSMTDADVLDATYFYDRNSGTGWFGGSAADWQKETQFDPTLWGTPGVDAWMASTPTPTAPQLSAMLPHRVQTSDRTKIVGFSSKPNPGVTSVTNTTRVINGADITSRGYPVLAAGLGALEITMPKVGLPTGTGTWQSVTMGEDGTGREGSDHLMHFKKAAAGQVSDGYCRVYAMLAEGWEPGSTPEKLRWNWSISNPAHVGKYPEEVGLSPSSVSWRVTDFSGKFPGGLQQQAGNLYAQYYYPPDQSAGPTVGVLNANGYSNSSGIYGYQGRMVFQQGFYKDGHPGPCVGGARVGLELYDFGQSSAMQVPSGSAIANNDNTAGWIAKWGMSHMKQGRWYCIEMRWKLNTLNNPYVKPPVGTHYLADSLVDGFLEWWVDGIYAGRSPLFGTRSALKIDWMLNLSNGKGFGADPSYFRPISNVPAEHYMGFATMVLQAYYGGRAPNPNDKKILLNGLVASNGAYIGPMAGVTRANGGLGQQMPSWRPNAGEATSFTAGAGVLTNNFRDVVAPYYEPFYSKKIVNDYSSSILAPDAGTYGSLLFYGSGHSAANDNSIVLLKPTATDLSFSRITNPTPWYGTGTDGTTKTNNSIGSLATAGKVTPNWVDAPSSIQTDPAPAAVHTYSMLAMIPATSGGAANGSLFVPNSAAGHEGPVAVGGQTYVGNGAHICDLASLTTPASNTWRRAATFLAGSGGWSSCHYSCYVPAQGRVYYFHRNTPILYWYNVATDSWGQSTGTPFDSAAAGYDFDSGVMIHVPSRNLLLYLTRFSAQLRIQWMDVSAGVANPTLGGTVTLSQTIHLKAWVSQYEAWRHAFWCPDTNKLVVSKTLLSAGGAYDATGLWEIDIPTTLNTTWTATRITPTGLNIPWFDRSWQSFVYFPSIKTALMLHAANDTGTPDVVYAYRPAGT